jgi:DNA-binding response OmpR family regulator
MNDTGSVVLVVDDNESTRRLFGNWLRRAGHRVLEATTGAEALATLATHSCDLVILDVHLPDMAGDEVCERIKGDPATDEVPVLHVSATAIEPADKSASLLRRADGYLIEPLEREELVATAEALLRYSAARRRAESLAARLETLYAASVAMHEAGEADALAVTVAETARDLTAAVTVVAVVRGEGALVIRANDGGITESRIGGAELGQLVMTPQAVLNRAFPSTAPERPLLPMVGRGRLRRASVMLLVDAQASKVEGVEPILRQLVHSAAVAAENQMFLSHEHSTALTLQRSLLPTIPAVEWLDVAYRYLPGLEQFEVGGDFYDLLRIDDDRVALVIGDVQGHSLWAATVMATLRSSLAAVLIQGQRPAVALDLLNQVLLRQYPDVIATVCCMVLDRSGRAVVATAGHPPPIVALDGRSWSIEVAGPLLGIELMHSQSEITVSEGSALIFFTDGLVERRGRSIDDGLETALAVAAVAEPDADRICDQLIEALGADATDDDVAVLVVRFNP